MGIAYLAVYTLRSTNTIDNWPTALLAVAVLVLCVPIAELLEARSTARSAVARNVAPEVPLEWVGITRPFTDADVRTMNSALGVSEVELYGTARR
jgi:hypothetical protein